jgi:UDP-N-acetyl-D-glucosamine/UDP-N-acetyl-D-galactosamine dehydrogenase
VSHAKQGDVLQGGSVADQRMKYPETVMNTPTVAVVGLGYVGLPLAVEFGVKYRTIGFDRSEKKISAYQRFEDPTGEVSTAKLRAAEGLQVTADESRLADADFIIVAVPTPVDEAHQPDFSPLISASEAVGRHMKRDAIVVYESTVYPGATEEICIPVLEKRSGMRWKQDFHVGYSPERINPGDKEHTLTKIAKVVSGDDRPTLDKVAALYGSVITAGVHRASSIAVAEAAKVIENTQRDLNVALMNELAIIFDRLGLDTSEVLAAAGTKWNFLKFKPGLVGGHCIGVDPYYLTHKAQMVGYHPQVILAGRHINDGMGKFIAEQTVKQMIAAGSLVKGAKVNVLGLTFKENCNDLRNSKVVDIINELKAYGIAVFVTDPQASPEEAMEEYGVPLLAWNDLPRADAMVAAVAHKEYGELTMASIADKLVDGGVLIDIKAMFDAAAVQGAGYRLWRL